MISESMTIDQVKESVQTFIRERDWDQYNDARSASMTVLIESIELLDALRSSSSSNNDQEAIEQELADVFFSLMHFAIRADIDISSMIYI